MASSSSTSSLTLTLTLIISFLCFSSTASPLPSSPLLPPPPSLHREALALLSMKQYLRDDLHRLHDWSSSSTDQMKQSSAINPCSWTGVSCSAVHHSDDNFHYNNSHKSNAVFLSITSIDLSSMNLSGALQFQDSMEASSTNRSAFPNLRNFSTADNKISGILPQQITHFRSLRFLNISNNYFMGALPGNTSNLMNLEVFDAFNNNFDGSLPLELTLCLNLRHLNLGGNFLAGPIHPQYGNMENLEYLNMAGNNLSGHIPPELGNLHSLKALFLGYFNVFHGSIPMELGSIHNLEILDLSESGLNGMIPPSLGYLTKLNTLFLQNNSFTGSIPSRLGRISSLKSLDLSNNYLSGTIPIELCDLVELELLGLLYNHIHGSIPDCIGTLPKLEVLKLFNNNLSGQIPARLGHMNPRLRQLDLSYNALSGPIPPHLCHGKNLEWLLLLENRISGQIPFALGFCESLTRIRLGSNELSGSIPSGFFFFPRLDILELSSNNLQGLALPDFSHNVSVVSIINLANNHLIGPLPLSMGNMRGLEKLDLSNNRINGTIPDQIGFLSEHLSTLDLSRNLITGALPDAIAQCIHLSILNVSGNALSGEIPGPIQEMSQLSVIDLSFNNFSGAIDPSSSEGGSRFTGNLLRGNPLLCGDLVSRPCIGNVNSSFGDSQAFGMNPMANVKLIGIPLLAFMLASMLMSVGILYGIRSSSSFRGALHSTWFNLKKSGIDRWWCCKMMMKKKKRRASSGWKLVKFETLDFKIDHVLSSLQDENIIGQGGTGTVYKGVMPGGRILAIKRLPAASTIDVSASVSSRERLLNDHGFSAEVQTLANVSHRHIVKLLGWCSNAHVNLLLYDYMPNGSLGELLHGKTDSNLQCHTTESEMDMEMKVKMKMKEMVLESWQARIKIALSAAEGLAYLHHDCFPPILHRDVKPNNILLDSRWEAKIADFGLAKPMLGADDSMSVIAGSYGYLAPEYAYTLKVNEKSDVYSYGVVLLELLTGRKPIGPEYGECVDIVKWARGQVHTEGGRAAMLDTRIRPPIISKDPSSLQSAMVLLTIAMKCVDEQPERRPSLRDVLKDLRCVDER